MNKLVLILITLLIAISLVFIACESTPRPFPPPTSQETTVTTTVTSPPVTVTSPPVTVTSPSTPTIPTPTPTLTSDIYSINQDVIVGKARWKLLSAINKGSVLKGAESRYPSFTEDKTTQGKFIEITLEVENIGTITEDWWSEPNLIDSQMREFKPASEVYEWIPEDKDSSMKSLQPNLPQQFIWIYEVPKDAIGLKVKIEDISFGGTAQALIDLGL